jgi:hypothetical protein
MGSFEKTAARCNTTDEFETGELAGRAYVRVVMEVVQRIETRPRLIPLLSSFGQIVSK